MAAKIVSVKALEILDSRGNPTVRVMVTLNNGIAGKASVPSGASTGENEALELRDGDAKRYGGKGVLKAVANVQDKIAAEVVGMEVSRQAAIDRLMLDLDGTQKKAKRAPTASVGVSRGVARPAALAAGLPLYQYLGGPGSRRLPVPCMNIINGGGHADNNVDLQEFMVVPLGAPSYREGLRYGAETFHALKGLLKKSNLATSVGDEGGFAPNLPSNEAAMEVIIQAIEKAGYEPGKDIAIALDSAASSFAVDKPGLYDLQKSGTGKKTSDEMIAMAEAWVKKYPVVSWEDPLSENDWEGFRKFTERLGDKIEIVGDDLFVTNTKYIARGIKEKSANQALTN